MKGRRVEVMKDGDWRTGEIIDFRAKSKEYYIHYIGYNRRLDEWVASSVVDLTRKVQNPVSIL